MLTKIKTSNQRVVKNEDIFNMLHEGENVKMTIKGNSMQPFITGGKDTITLIKANKNTLKKGDIVVAKLDDEYYVMHRIASIDGNTITLRGDGNPYLREQCPRENILAEAIEVHHNGKIYKKGSWSWKAARVLWPSNGFVRRALLFIYRRVIL